MEDNSSIKYDDGINVVDIFQPPGQEFWCWSVRLYDPPMATISTGSHGSKKGAIYEAAHSVTSPKMKKLLLSVYDKLLVTFDNELKEVLFEVLDAGCDEWVSEMNQEGPWETGDRTVNAMLEVLQKHGYTIQKNWRN